MEININSLKTVDLWPVAGSIATHGTNATTQTFDAAKSVGSDCLDTPEKLEAYRSHLEVRGMDETENFNADELNAILIQEVALELRENGLDCLEDLKGFDHECQGNLFYGIDGNFYFYAGE